MNLIFIIIFILLIITFGIYKLCVYLNTNISVTKKKTNNIIIKLSLSCLFIFLILLLYNGIDGYLNGKKGIFCEAIYLNDCYDYGIEGAFLRIILNFYWTIPIIYSFFLYIFIYKIKYKKKLINNKLLCFIIIILLIFISLLPFYKPITNNLYFKFTEPNYEIIVKDYDYNDYYINVYDKKINVTKKEKVICFQAPCEPLYNGEYEITFSKTSMSKIYNYINQLFYNKEFNTITITYNNDTSNNETNIIKAIITNNESYLKNEHSSYTYKITTDLRWKTMQNDGGSNFNEYYEIYLDEQKIIKYNDYYVGFKGYKYKDEIVYEKSINTFTKTKLENIIKKLITNEDINDKNNYSPFTIEYDNNKKNIYNEESIKSLENILTSIDNQ